MSEQALLEVDRLSVSYRTQTSFFQSRNERELWALRDVSLQVARGSTYGIVGESGSGKSTLARVVAGLLAPTEGSISLDGLRLDFPRGRQGRRRIQMVFQDPSSSLNPKMRVGDALSDAMTRQIPRPADRRRRVAELLEMVRLDPELMTRKPAELSGGQRQRVAIARALCAEPDLLIADEATSALDATVQAAVLDTLRELREDTGVTLLFITHDLATMSRICDQVTVMRNGAVVESGYVHEVFDKPTNPYTKELIDAIPHW